MIGTIHSVIRIAGIWGVCFLIGSDLHGQSTQSQSTVKGLPEAPTLGPHSSGLSLGASPGALEPSSFAASDTGVVGGKARGGTGRIPRKLLKPKQVTTGTTSRNSSVLALPAASPDLSPTDLNDDDSEMSLASIIDDEGASDGLSLDAALARLLVANLDLLALKYEIPQADADILTAGLRSNPLIFTDAQLIPYGSYSSARPVGPTEYDLSITYPLDLSNKRRSRVDVARAAKCVIEAQFQDAARRQVGNLYRAFVDLQAARLNVLTSESAVKAQEQVILRAGQRKVMGDDLTRLAGQLDKARDSLEDSRDAFEDAKESIALLLDLPAEATAKLQPHGGLRDVAPAPPPLEELTRLTLATRPDLVAARRGNTRADSEVKLARANRFDDVFIFYDPLSYQDNRITHQQSGRSWALGVTVPLPIYNRNQGNIARAVSNVQQSHVELAALERRVTSEVRLAEREYRTSRLSLERAMRATRSEAHQARAKTALEFAQGKLSLSDYLDRLEEDGDAARAYRDALVRHRRSMLDLNTTVGLRILP